MSNSVRQATDKPGQALRPARVWEWVQTMRRIERDALSPTARHAMHALALFADPDGGNCYPTYEALGEAMGLSRAQAGAAIKELAEKGWIERRRIIVHGKPRTLFVPLVPAGALSGTPDASPSGTPDATCTSDLTKRHSDADASAGRALDDIAELERDLAEVVAHVGPLSVEHGDDGCASEMLARGEPVKKVVNTIKKRERERFSKVA